MSCFAAGHQNVNNEPVFQLGWEKGRVQKGRVQKGRVQKKLGTIQHANDQNSGTI